MSKSSLLLLVAIALILGIASIVWYSSGSTAQTPVTDVTPATSTAFTVNADDATTTLPTITVHRGDSVAVTFAVNSSGTYHGGLDFRSPIVSTGAIAPGENKTVNFTATDSFAFIPYWAGSSVKDPYTVQIVVQ